MGSSPNRGQSLPDVIEDEDDNVSMCSDHNHFQLQILVTPCHGPDGGTEIKVSGGIANPRPGSRKLPPIHNAQGSRWFGRHNPGTPETPNAIRSRLQTLPGDGVHSDSIPFIKHRITPTRKHSKYINNNNYQHCQRTSVTGEEIFLGKDHRCADKPFSEHSFSFS